MRLFEFGDLPWVPNLYHIYLRKYLVLFYKLFGYHKLWVPKLEDFINKTESNTYMECCSGSGEPLQLIYEHLSDNIKSHRPHFLLSDIQPHAEFIHAINIADNSNFHYIESPIDATQYDPDYHYPKLFINSFHHFSPELAKEVLVNNLKNNNEIIIFEYVRNTPLGYISMFMGPLVLLLTLPFVVKPRDLPLTALFTYIVPLFPLMFLWDGLVSCKHEYSEKKLRSLIKDIEIPVKITSKISRNLLYPAGVSAISFTL